MARISTYNIDPNITADDKWIGTDFNTQYTKNFTPQYLADFFNTSNSIGVSGQVSFKYYSIFPGYRPEESITTSTVDPNFSTITSLKIHKNSGGGNYCIDFINYLSDDEILISDTSNADIFGHFKLNSVTQDLSETNFYNLDVTYIGGHGNLEHLKVYSIALYSAAVQDPVIPNLQQVTDAGHITTNNIYINSLVGEYGDYTTSNQLEDLGVFQFFTSPTQENYTSYYAGYGFGLSSTLNNLTKNLDAYESRLALYSYDSSNNNYNGFLEIDANDGNGSAFLRLQNKSNKSGLLKVTDLTNNIVLQFPNKTTGTYTVATTADITTPTLQQVLDNNHDLVNGNNFQGTGAGVLNTGNQVIGFGTGTVNSNSGVNVNAFGVQALQANTGRNVNGFGEEVGASNTYKNVNLFGYRASADADNQNVFSKWISGNTRYLGKLSFNNITTDQKWELPDVSGTIALTSNIGNWGALNYPTWTTGTPFVKMTAAGTFALDTNTYVTTANATLQNAYNNSTDGKIILDLTRGAVKFQAITGTTNTIESYHSGGGLVFTVSNVGNVVGQYIYGTWFNTGFNAGLQDNSGTVQFKSQYDGIAGQGRWESNQRINYLADYSALYSNRSLIDKGYADATYMPISSTGGGIPHATAAGTDTYTATVTGVTSYADGDAYLIRFTNGNTTGATLNINGLGAITLYRNNDGVLIGGDITSGGEMICVYNSTTNSFQCIGTAPNSLFSYVTNADSVTLTKGMPVYAFGGTGDRMTVKRAYNTGDSTSAQTVGLVLSTSIATNQKGLIMMQGLLDGLSILPTSTWADGDTVYLGATAGTITNVKPHAPNHLVYLGVVTTSSNGAAGRMYVRVQNGYELDELHNVQAQSPSLNDTLWYDNTVSPAQWKTASIPTILGYTPPNLGLVQAMTQGLQNIF